MCTSALLLAAELEFTANTTPLTTPLHPIAMPITQSSLLLHTQSAAYLSMGDADKALDDAESCIKVNGSWAKGYTRKGAALHKLKR